MPECNTSESCDTYISCISGKKILNYDDEYIIQTVTDKHK